MACYMPLSTQLWRVSTIPSSGGCKASTCTDRTCRIPASWLGSHPRFRSNWQEDVGTEGSLPNVTAGQTHEKHCFRLPNFACMRCWGCGRLVGSFRRSVVIIVQCSVEMTVRSSWMEERCWSTPVTMVNDDTYDEKHSSVSDKDDIHWLLCDQLSINTFVDMNHGRRETNFISEWSEIGRHEKMIYASVRWKRMLFCGVFSMTRKVMMWDDREFMKNNLKFWLFLCLCQLFFQINQIILLKLDR